MIDKHVQSMLMILSNIALEQSIIIKDEGYNEKTKQDKINVLEDVAHEIRNCIRRINSKLLV